MYIYIYMHTHRYVYIYIYIYVYTHNVIVKECESASNDVGLGLCPGLGNSNTQWVSHK